MKPSSYSPTSQLSDYSQPSSHLAPDSLSVLLNIDKTVAKSHQIYRKVCRIVARTMSTDSS